MLGRQRAAEPAQDIGASPASDSDAGLIGRIVGRDRRAFEALYRAYHPRLTRFLMQILKRPHLVEEVLNDTMLVVWRRPERYNGKSKVSTWIFAIAYRKALKALRRSDEPVDDAQAIERASPDEGPEQQLGRVQARSALVAAMRELSADHRAVVDLTYFHDFGYREISELMDCPLDTVKTRMFHARRRLKALLSGKLADWL